MKNKRIDQQQMQILHSRINELNEQVENLEEVVRQQKMEIQQSNRGENEYERENKLLRDHCKELMDTNLDLENQMNSQAQYFREQINQLEIKICIVLEDNERLSVIHQNEQKQNQMQRESKQLSQQLIDITSEKDKLYKQFIYSNAQLLQVKTEYMKLTEQMIIKDQESSELVNQVSYLQNQIHSLKQNNLDLKQLLQEKQQFIDQANQSYYEIVQNQQKNDQFKKKFIILENEFQLLNAQKQELIKLKSESSNTDQIQN